MNDELGWTWGRSSRGLFLEYCAMLEDI